MNRQAKRQMATASFALAVCLLLSAISTADSYYWDTNGASSGSGSAGGGTANWLSNSWATGSSGNQPTGAWPNTQPENSDEAIFQGTEGTVSVNADVYANALNFLSRNYVIDSTGGSLYLSGSAPAVNVSPPSLGNNGQQTVRVSAPIAGTNGFTLTGNGLSGGFKFLQLENNSAASPNTFSGTLTIAAGGSLRIGGAMDREQIPDDVDLDIVGVIDFNTSGGASDMKQERVRNVNVDGAGAIFSVGNGSDFIVNSIAGTDATNISINGNNASVPGKLSITGWADGGGDLSLHSSSLKLNTTGSQAAIGGRVILSGAINSSGESQVINNNGGGNSTPDWDDNVFTNKAFDFAAAEHTIDVADGTLTFTSRAPSYPLEITTIQPEGAIITKVGAGTLRFENAVQTDFAGATKVLDGTLSLARPALADAADVYVATGATLDLDFSGVDVVNSLFIDGMSQLTGTWGSPTSSAEHMSPLLTGSGILQVTTFVEPVLPGDYNGDHVVDAADYTVWRDNLGTTTELPNDLVGGEIGAAQYDQWKQHFGASDLGSGSIAAVPEPTAAVAAALGIVCLTIGASRRRLPFVSAETALPQPA
jgi:autotransporter-associated beta strand protein